MSIKTKIAAFAIAAVVATGGIAASTSAEAHSPHPGIGLGVGLATGLVVGSALAATQPQYIYPVRRCGWTPQYNVFGQYVGSIRTCNVY